jgi:hypothetical protein
VESAITPAGPLEDSTVQTTTTTTTAQAENALRARGFVPGCPPQVTAAVLLADKQAYARQLCPACGRRGARFKPYHRGREYGGVVACRHCPAGEEA